MILVAVMMIVNYLSAKSNDKSGWPTLLYTPLLMFSLAYIVEKLAILLIKDAGSVTLYIFSIVSSVLGAVISNRIASRKPKGTQYNSEQMYTPYTPNNQAKASSSNTIIENDYTITEIKDDLDDDIDWLNYIYIFFQNFNEQTSR